MLGTGESGGHGHVVKVAMNSKIHESQKTQLENCLRVALFNLFFEQGHANRALCLRGVSVS